jgi:hypothetical protein
MSDEQDIGAVLLDAVTKWEKAAQKADGACNAARAAFNEAKAKAGWVQVDVDEPVPGAPLLPPGLGDYLEGFCVNGTTYVPVSEVLHRFQGTGYFPTTEVRQVLLTDAIYARDDEPFLTLEDARGWLAWQRAVTKAINNYGALAAATA